jgi:dihydroorotate dehydrogenase
MPHSVLNILAAIAHRLLLFLPPETAHNVGIYLLRRMQGFLGARRATPPPKGPRIVLRAFPELSFRTRVGLAAGFDKNAEVLPALAALGFGFIEAGTVTPLHQSGNPRPRLWRRPGEVLVNQMGFNNCGLEQFKANLVRSRDRVGIPVFANIGKGKNTSLVDAAADYEACMSLLAPWVDGFVINISSPNTPGIRDLQSVEFLESLAKGIGITKPVLIKLAPDISGDTLAILCSWVLQSPIAGVVLANTSATLARNLGFPSGGLSGPPLFERMLEMISTARKILPCPKVIIGAGGISSKKDADRAFAAGADLIEVLSAFVYRGPGLIRSLSS